MLREPGLGDPKYVPSTKDQILGVIFVICALLCFGLSFTLFQANGRPVLFGGCLVTCGVCLTFADNRKGIALAFVIFLGIRVIWAFIARGL
jgi:hypothetical protein